jgi:hypothetical protein
MRLYGFSAPVMLSSLRCGTCLLFSHISAFTWRIVSCNDMVDFTCRKLSSDVGLMWVFCVALSNSTIVFLSSRPATWFFSLPDTMDVPSVKIVVELVST